MKVGIIISRDFFAHNGVRNYVLALGAMLSERMRVDYVARLPNEANSAQWYTLQPLAPRHAAPPATGSDRIEGSPLEVFKKYQARGQQPPPATPAMPHCAVGSDLAVERYDVLIISSPWAVDFSGRLPAPKVIGLAFDTIPNTIGFTTWDTRPFVFAAQHAHGYQYYCEHTDLVYAISQDTADSLAALFGVPPDKTVALPPFLPSEYVGRPIPDIARGPNLVLAAPFDLRKGLTEMPALINPSAHVLGRLGIYGQPRCALELVARFFDELDEGIRVEWYPRATTDEVMSLFASSRLLLFPSHSEGLGLPILEAQACGARVAARAIRPMADNMLTGAVPLSQSPADDAHRIAEVLADDDFNHDALKRQAAARFSPHHVRSVLFDTVGDGPTNGADDGVTLGPADRQPAGSGAPGGTAAVPLSRARPCNPTARAG